MNSDDLRRRIQARLWSLNKTVGNLGKLAGLALRFALLRGCILPELRRKAIYIFCADHGVTAEGVSAYPSEVTQQMVKNFVQGGAAITVLCRHYAIDPVVVDMGVLGPPEPSVRNHKVAPGTQNFAIGPAMTRTQAQQAIDTGIALALEAAQAYDVLGAGEMGIGNSTSAAALLCAFTGCDSREAAGRGTGLDDDSLRHKADVIRRALDLHPPDPNDPIGVLAAVGGFEIGAIAGFLIGAAHARVPLVMDGFISCSAALVARAIAPSCMEAAVFSHRSAERGHARLLQALDAAPLLDLEMRLGEGSAAALAINLLEAAVKLYREMPTFSEAEASVSHVPVE